MKKQEFLTLARSMTQPGFYHTSYYDAERNNKLIIECRLVDEVGEQKSELLFTIIRKEYIGDITKDDFLKKFKPYNKWLQQIQLERLMK